MAQNQFRYYVTIDGKAVEGATPIREYAFSLYSPITLNLSSEPIRFKDRHEVFYIHIPHDRSLKTITDPREIAELIDINDNPFNDDIQRFMCSCRASKRTTNYYYMERSQNLEEIEAYARAHPPYNIVSGDKLPDNPTERDRRNIAQYLQQGLHLLWLFDKRGLGNAEYDQVRTRLISRGSHNFQREDFWALNMSNIFIATLINYYEITSGIAGKSAQVSFIEDSNYRLLVFEYIKKIFINFCEANRRALSDLSVHNIIRNVKEILEEWIAPLMHKPRSKSPVAIRE
jgi:hypothetical protein